MGHILVRRRGFYARCSSARSRYKNRNEHMGHFGTSARPLTWAWEVARTVVAPPSSVVKCLWGVFVSGFGVFSCRVCVSVSGVLFSVGVCVSV